MSNLQVVQYGIHQVHVCDSGSAYSSDSFLQLLKACLCTVGLVSRFFQRRGPGVSEVEVIRHPVIIQIFIRTFDKFT